MNAKHLIGLRQCDSCLPSSGKSELPEEAEGQAKGSSVEEAESELATDTLCFFRPMATKTSKEMFEKVKEIYLQLRNENLPVIRIHGDRTHEFYSAQLRSWATDRDIVITRTEGQSPASNGVAERAIRFLKQALAGSCGPRTRALAVGPASMKIVYGARVLVKRQVCGQGPAAKMGGIGAWDKFEAYPRHDGHGH